MALFGWLAATVAWGGAGPWVVGEGQGSLYLGVETQRLTRLAITVDGDRQVIDVGEGLSTFGVKAIGSLGLTRHFEVEAMVPWWRVQANRPDAQLCADLGLAACQTVSGLGVLEVRAKVLVVDEFFGPPLSVAVGGEVRAGQFTHPTRERITNVGEGTSDLGGFVSVGRSAALGGDGYWSGFVELGGRYRFPVTTSYPTADGETRQAPGSEFTASTELVFGPSRRVAFGPVAAALWRPFGVDWGQLDLTDVDRLGALRVFNARIGATAVVRGPLDLSVSLTVLRSVYTVNNPTDVLSVSAGLQTMLRRRRVDDAR